MAWPISQNTQFLELEERLTWVKSKVIELFFEVVVLFFEVVRAKTAVSCSVFSRVELEFLCDGASILRRLDHRFAEKSIRSSQRWFLCATRWGRSSYGGRKRC
jgi:hypothetical protein